VRNILYLDNNAKGAHCCISVVTLNILYCWQQCEIFCISTTAQREPIVAFSWQHWTSCIVDSSAKYFVSRQQCKGNPLLHFHGNTEHLILLTAVRNVFISTTVQREPIVAFPWQHWTSYIVDSSAKYFVSRQQCKGNPLLHFHGNTEHLILLTAVRIILYLDNSAKGTHCCISMATLDILYCWQQCELFCISTTVQREPIVAFPWQHWTSYIVDSSANYFVSRQQCKGNPLLHFHGDTERLILLTATCISTRIRWKCIVSFPW